MPALTQATAQMTLDALTAVGAFTATATGLNVRLTTTAPTATAAGTELTGTGYTAGGSNIAFGSASAATPTVASNTGVVSWTNGSGGSWSIVGIELWDRGGTPVRKFYGTFTGQPITVANGNIFQINAAGVTISFNG